MATYRGEHEADFARFLDVMRHKMASSKFRGQRRFETDPLEDLIQRFRDEVKELEEALTPTTDGKELSWFNVILEAGDVANFAMFIGLRAIKMMGGDPRTEDEKRAPEQELTEEQIIPKYGRLVADLKQGVTMNDSRRIAQLDDDFDKCMQPAKQQQQAAFDPSEAIRITPPEGYIALNAGEQCQLNCPSQWTDGNGHYWCCGQSTIDI